MTIDVDALRAEHESVFGESACPQWAIDSLTAYSIAGIPPGDCLMAFLENDLMGACQRADIETGRRIAAIAGHQSVIPSAGADVSSASTSSSNVVVMRAIYRAISSRC